MLSDDSTDPAQPNPGAASVRPWTSFRAVGQRCVQPSLISRMRPFHCHLDLMAHIPDAAELRELDAMIPLVLS